MAIVRKLFAYHFVSNIAIVCGIIGFGNGTITGYPICQTWTNYQLTSNAFFVRTFEGQTGLRWRI